MVLRLKICTFVDSAHNIDYSFKFFFSVTEWHQHNPIHTSKLVYSYWNTPLKSDAKVSKRNFIQQIKQVLVSLKAPMRSMARKLESQKSRKSKVKSQKSKVTISRKVKSQGSLGRESSKFEKTQVSRSPAHSLTYTGMPRAHHRS